SFEERLRLFFHSVVEGDKPVAFQAFTGLADEAVHDEAKRKALEAEVIFSGIIDLPGPRLLPGAGVNPAHKAIRARALVDLANALGWDQAYPLYYVVIPDLANNPRHHDLFDTTHALLSAEIGKEYRELRHANT